MSLKSTLKNQILKRQQAYEKERPKKGHTFLGKLRKFLVDNPTGSTLGRVGASLSAIPLALNAVNKGKGNLNTMLSAAAIGTGAPIAGALAEKGIKSLRKSLKQSKKRK